MNKEIEKEVKRRSKEIIKEIMPDLRKQLKQEVIKEIKRDRQKKVYHNTYILMSHYNKFKQHIKKVKITDEIEDLDKFMDGIKEDDFVEDYIIEINAADEKFIKSILKSKIRTATMIAFIDEALNIIKSEYEAKGKYDHYRAFELFFIEEKTNKEIQEELFCGINTPRKWSKEILKELSLLLWGIDAFTELVS